MGSTHSAHNSSSKRFTSCVNASKVLAGVKTYPKPWRKPRAWLASLSLDRPAAGSPHSNLVGNSPVEHFFFRIPHSKQRALLANQVQ